MTAGVDRRSLVLKGVLDLCLLALLQQRPVYGYELTEMLAEQGLEVGNGTAYPLLARMQKFGYVEIEKRPSANGPPRKYYALAAAGRSALEAGRQEWSTIADAVSDLLGSRPLVSDTTQEGAHT